MRVTPTVLTALFTTDAGKDDPSRFRKSTGPFTGAGASSSAAEGPCSLLVSPSLQSLSSESLNSGVSPGCCCCCCSASTGMSVSESCGSTRSCKRTGLRCRCICCSSNGPSVSLSSDSEELECNWKCTDCRCRCVSFFCFCCCNNCSPFAGFSDPRCTLKCKDFLCRCSFCHWRCSPRCDD